MLDLILENANVLTMDAARPRARRLGIWCGRIAGLDEEIDGLTAADTIDLGGATVLPGFIDAHTHLALTGQQMRATDIAGLESHDDVLAVIAEAAKAIEPGEWLEVGGYEHSAFGGSHLTAAQLEAAAPGRKVYVRHISGHAGVVSPAVLAGLPAAALDDPRVRAGLLEENDLAHLRAQLLPYPIDRIKHAIRTAAQAARADGVTMCHDAGIGLRLGGLSGVDALAYQELLEAGELPMRMQVMPELVSLEEQEVAASDGFRRVLPWGLATGFGSDMLRLGATKVQLDGGLMVHSAALTSDYCDADGRGWLNDEPDHYIERLVDAHRAGWQLAIHAIGDHAVDVAIDALRRCAQIEPRRRLPHRIEHASVVRPDQAQALGELGAAIVTQPCFVHNSTEEYIEAMGPDRVDWLYRWRSLEDHGARLVSSTDRPLLGTPLEGIQSLVTRTSRLGTQLTPHESLDLDRAIATWTVDGAWVAGMADRLGRLSRGFLADLTILAEDPHHVPADSLRQIEVVGTVVDGAPQWS